MKILHVITRSSLGGAQFIVASLANAMCTKYDIVVAAGENGPMWDVLDNRVKKIPIMAIKRELSLFYDIMALCKLFILYYKERPDVVHLHSTKIGALGRIVFPASKIIYSVHGFDSIRLAYRKYLPIERLLKNRCKAIVVASHYDKRNLIKEGIRDNIHVVYNGICTSEQEKNIIISELDHSKKTIMCIARISAQKRFDLFVEMAQCMPEYNFVWIGAEEVLNDLPKNLFCLEGRKNAKKYLQIADIFILPSNYEGIPIVIMDALSYAKPVISSNVGGISEIVINGVNGYVVDNRIESFVNRIKYVLENPQVYSQLSIGALKIFDEKLNIYHMIDGYEKIYLA